MKRGQLARRVATAALLLGAAVGITAGCLADLREPTSCPPSSALTSCISSMSMPPAPGSSAGCFDSTTMQCLGDQKIDCRCPSGADPCPDDPAACFPGSSCPPTVRSKASGASCPRLGPEAIGATSPGSSSCLCGCARCATVCDGRGLLLGVVANTNVRGDGGVLSLDGGPPALEGGLGEGGASGATILRASLSGVLPSSGRLGVYVRWRGQAAATLTFGGGSAMMPTPAGAFRTVKTADFEEQFLVGDESLGPAGGPADTPVHWSTQSEAPTSIDISIASVNDLGAGAIEIDCIIPVVLPP